MEIIGKCFIELVGYKFPAELFLMTLGGFDVVLGMDWLSANDAQILCKKKVMNLKAPSGDVITVYGDRVPRVPYVISMVKASKMMNKGCEAYLAYAINKVDEIKELKDVPVVNEFPDVFPEGLPGVPHDRDLEFRIELVPGAKPVAKVLYRLALREMKELMKQLQELLNKGFIRPSASPWGALVLFVKKRMGVCVCVWTIGN